MDMAVRSFPYIHTKILFVALTIHYQEFIAIYVCSSPMISKYSDIRRGEFYGQMKLKCDMPSILLVC